MALYIYLKATKTVPIDVIVYTKHASKQTVCQVCVYETKKS